MHVHNITGITQGWLSRLASGHIAGVAHALTLKRALGIELEWWGMPPLKERKAKGRAA